MKWVVRNEDDPQRRISSLGGDEFDHSIVEAIVNVHLEECRYWVVIDGSPVWIVLDARPSTAYLRSENDVGEPDELLKLATDQPAFD